MVYPKNSPNSRAASEQMKLASCWRRGQDFEGECPFLAYWGAFHPVPEIAPGSGDKLRALVPSSSLRKREGARPVPRDALATAGDPQFSKISDGSSQSRLSSNNQPDGATCWRNGKPSLGQSTSDPAPAASGRVPADLLQP